MKTYIFAVFALLLSACATTGTEMQAECEAQYRKFPDIYRCTYDAVAKRNPAILKDARAKLYLLRGEQLTQEVDEGRTSSLDAKVLWQKTYVELKTAKDQEISAAVDSLSRSLETTRAACRPIVQNPQVNCTSQRLGAPVTTNCW